MFLVLPGGPSAFSHLVDRLTLSGRLGLGFFQYAGGASEAPQDPVARLAKRMISLAVKVAVTAFVIVLVPVYRRHYGVANFLWFSDVALLLSVPALWLESSLLASMIALATAVPELGWNLDFFIRLATGRSPIGLAGYMFDRRLGRGLRALSLFHLWLPFLALWMVAVLGYDRRAWPAQAALGSLLLIASYLWTEPSRNINWVFGPGTRPQQRVRPIVYLLLALLSFQATYAATHVLLIRLRAVSRLR